MTYNPNSSNSIRGEHAEQVVKNWLHSQGVVYSHPGYTCYGPDKGDIEINGTIFDVKTVTEARHRNICVSKRKDVHIDYIIAVDYNDNILGACHYSKVREHERGYDLISFNSFTLSALLQSIK